MKGFSALGERGEEKCDVGQRRGATDGDIEGEGDKEEQSKEAGEAHRGVHRCVCRFKMDVGEEGWFLLIVAGERG